MGRRLLSGFFQVAAVFLLLLCLLITWMMFDGLVDQQEHVDVGLVAGSGEVPEDQTWEMIQARLDLASQLYANNNEFPIIIVSGPLKTDKEDQVAMMTQYLVSHSVPATAIIEERHANTHEMAHNVAAIMQQRKLTTLELVSEYYQTTRLKMALKVEGIKTVDHVHLGRLQKSDAKNIANELIAFCKYAGKYYLMPETKKLTEKSIQEVKVGAEEAKAGADKVKDGVQNAKNSTDKGLDSLSK